ncbi:MAG: tetratricopeptide repeat protein [Clostridia bacterium]|nr:tetratricopeptide repeat protein [Clostridia bacterium]
MIKKITLFALSLLTTLSLFSCSGSNYSKAVDLYENGKYEEALALFTELGDYEDSLAMVKECNYELAIIHIQNEEYDEAQELFESLADFKESEKYLAELSWKKFHSHLKNNGSITINETLNTAPYTITVSSSGENIQVVCDSTQESQTSMVSIIYTAILAPQSKTATLSAVGKITLLGAEMNDEGKTEWNISTYKIGDEVKWEESSSGGRDLSGNPIKHPNGIALISSKSSLKELTSGLKAALLKSGTGTTISDLGFLAL